MRQKLKKRQGEFHTSATQLFGISRVRLCLRLRHRRRRQVPCSPLPLSLCNNRQEAIARYGNLLTKYYEVLDQLPPDALPTSPPVGKHQHRIVRGSGAATVALTMNLKSRVIFAHHPTKDNLQVRVQMRQIRGIATAWLRAKAVVLAWTKATVAPGPTEYQELYSIADQALAEFN